MGWETEAIEKLGAYRLDYMRLCDERVAEDGVATTSDNTKKQTVSEKTDIAKLVAYLERMEARLTIRIATLAAEFEAMKHGTPPLYKPVPNIGTSPHTTWTSMYQQRTGKSIEEREAVS